MRSKNKKIVSSKIQTEFKGKWADFQRCLYLQNEEKLKYPDRSSGCLTGEQQK
jgi:hypothetical protein